jgi:hypothetical protein
MPSVVEPYVEWASTIHVLLEFCYTVDSAFHLNKGKQKLLTNSCLRLLNLSKLDNTASLGSSTIEKDFSEFNLPSSLEQLDKVFICSRPRELTCM